MLREQKIICKIKYSPGQANDIIEVIGEVDKHRLESQEYKMLIVQNKYNLAKGQYSNKFFIAKKEIIEIIKYEEKERHIINKKNLDTCEVIIYE